jgi:hypothetical protein
MDAEGARALTRRIQEGRGTPASPRPSKPNSEVLPEPARYGVRIYSTERCPVFDGARSVVLIRRVCKTLVDGEWIVSVLREEYVDASAR